METIVLHAAFYLVVGPPLAAAVILLTVIVIQLVSTPSDSLSLSSLSAIPLSAIPLAFIVFIMAIAFGYIMGWAAAALTGAVMALAVFFVSRPAARYAVAAATGATTSLFFLPIGPQSTASYSYQGLVFAVVAAGGAVAALGCTWLAIRAGLCQPAARAAGEGTVQT